MGKPKSFFGGVKYGYSYSGVVDGLKEFYSSMRKLNVEIIISFYHNHSVYEAG